MKAKQVHDMTTEELKLKLTDLKKELFNLRFSHATGQLSNPMVIVDRKRDIARVLTVLRQRELSGVKETVEPVKKEAVKKTAKK